MSTSLAPMRTKAAVKEDQPYVDPTPKRHTGIKVVAIVVVWVILWAIFRGRDTLTTPFDQLNWFSRWGNTLQNTIQSASQTNWFFHGVLGQLSTFVNWVFNNLDYLLAAPSPGRPVPIIGWLGVVALLTWLAYAAAGARMAIGTFVAALLLGVCGFWQHGIETLIVTVLAVAVCLVIGIPTGISMARSKTVSSVLTPFLDAMQTIPSFCYLLPVFLLFGPGTMCAIVLTVVYAVPPLIRITEHGIRSVSATTQEAARSLGVTRGQLLRQVQLPMARRTIVVGINQCTLAALAMSVIAAYVNGPGLGLDVVQALIALNVGQGAVPGLLIVVIAIALDRVTTAASERADLAARASSQQKRRRRMGLIVGAAVTVVAIYLSHTFLQAAQFPTSVNIGPSLATGINDATNWFTNAIGHVTLDFKNVISYGFLNPLQQFLANTPWWVMAPVLLALAWALGGLRALLFAAGAVGVIFAMGLWNDSMVTLTSTLVATVLTMIVAIVLGVLMGRSRRTDTGIRPILDFLQTIPAFVYLIPALAFFGSTRFTAIIAGTAYAIPIATKLVADGIRGVSATTVEAASASGSTSWQMITKVQLPMARNALVLATNQGLLYVLSMVVIGGLVGAGSLGYLVVSGFSQASLFGKGLAAGVAITALGIMTDRITRGAAARYGT